MTFTVEWMSSEGRVSVVLPTALGAYQEAERVTKLGMRDVSVRLPNGDLIDWQTFRCRSNGSDQTTDGMNGLD
jgi:hypothetical protein